MSKIVEHPLTSKIRGAFHRAARKVVRLAKQTGTPVIVWEDGRIREIPCDSPELEAWADKPGKLADQG
jgi:hypothetical protein